MTDRLREFLAERFGDALVREAEFRGEVSFYVRPERLLDICQALREDPELEINHLKDIASVDWLGHPEEAEGRFEVVYNLYSLKHCYRFFLRVRLPAENPKVPSLTPLWNGADWLEREVYDMMGIEFEGHPNLTRILTPDDFEGHPLRHDYPLVYEVPQFTWNKDAPPEVIR